MSFVRIGTAFGPQEPEWCRIARDTYWQRTLRLLQLEGRIQMTDSGLAWLMRVKAIGGKR